MDANRIHMANDGRQKCVCNYVECQCNEDLLGFKSAKMTITISGTDAERKE